MAAVPFDTLKFSERLVAGGFTPAQAKAAAEAFADATGQELVTKADLHGELAPIRAEMLLLKWMAGFNLAIGVAIIAKLFTH